MRNLREPREPDRTREFEQNQEQDRIIEPERHRPRAVPPQGPRDSDVEEQLVEDSEHLLPKRQIEEMRSRWTSIQAAFVDEPRRAVEEADALVASAIKMISEGFVDQKSQLEKQWSRGGEASTESLRVALQQYRSFFSRLLSL